MAVNCLELAADHRTQAAKMTRQSLMFEDPLVRSWYLEIAATHQRLAEYLEKRGSLERALQQPTQPEQARDMAAAANPSLTMGPLESETPT
jgi:hypothetical protein